MSLDLEVSTNLRELTRALETLRRDQLPYAVAQALTSTAFAARDRMRAELPDRFTIRSAGVVRGFQATRADKRQRPRIFATVGTRDAFWLLQETGGRKRPRGGGALAIPTRAVRRTKAGRITKAQRPPGLGPRATQLEDRRLRRVLALAKPKRGDRRRILYLLRREARIEPRLGLRETVDEVTRRRLPVYFRRAYLRALATARPRGRG